MNIIILGGFLGSGKTTLLMSLAKFLTARAKQPGTNEVVILENEIGESGVDDKTLRAGGFTVDTLFAGCVCCTVSGELTAAAQRIRDELAPNWFIIETTGVAYPPLIRENLEAAFGTRARIAVVIDAPRWTRLLRAMRPLITAQLEGADVALVNKCDVITPEAADAVEADVRKLNETVAVERISAAAGVSETVLCRIAGAAL